MFCFVLLTYLNWRLITLQYCGGFCHTLTWISHGCTCVPLSQTLLLPPSPSHSSGSSQCTGFECPISCTELGLVIYFTYGNIHVWTFLGIAFLWDWNETELFQSCGHCWVFQICWHIECITFTASSFRIWNSSTGILSPPLALFVVMLSKVLLTLHSRMSDSR